MGAGRHRDGGAAGPRPAAGVPAGGAGPRSDPRRRPAPDGGVSRREAEVLDLVVESRTNAEIAARLFISERTVESHVSSLLRKLDASDRRDLIRRARARPAPEPLGTGGAAAAGARAAGRSRPASSAGPPNVTLLRDRWQLAVAGHTLLVVVAAEAGMGKSRLVAELAAEVHADGGRVLFGACYEDVEQPYGPFVQAIADAVDAGPGDVPTEVARVLPGAAPAGHTERGRPGRTRCGDRRHPALADDGRGVGADPARDRGPALVDGHDPRGRPPTRPHRRSGAPARRGHDAGHRAGPRRRPGHVARRSGALARRSPPRAARPRPRRGRRARRASRPTTPTRSSPTPAATRCSSPT